ncbi:MAG: Zn-dependent alcohol dehydrogenase [Mycobacteriales bacterium]
MTGDAATGDAATGDAATGDAATGDAATGPVRAAVLREYGAPLVIEEITLAPTGPDQVRVRIEASGVCHSDLSIATGALPHPLPVVLGHEGAGVVLEVGADVTHVRPGDHVVLAWTPACGACWFCERGERWLCERAIPDMLTSAYSSPDEHIYPALGAATFATETLVLGRAAVPVDPALPFEVAALVGCAVTTGVGAVLNTAEVVPGSSVMVLGCGGVGLSVVMGARLAGATTIIAVDLDAAKLDLAGELGATDAVLATEDVVAAVRERTGGRGADYTFEVIGRSDTIGMAWRCARRGGRVTVVGAGRFDDPVSLPAFELFHSAKVLQGCQYGSSVPERDFPRFLDLYRGGQLPLDRLVDARIGLDEVNGALSRMAAGKGARSVIVR